MTLRSLDKGLPRPLLNTVQPLLDYLVASYNVLKDLEGNKAVLTVTFNLNRWKKKKQTQTVKPSQEDTAASVSKQDTHIRKQDTTVSHAKDPTKSHQSPGQSKHLHYLLPPWRRLILPNRFKA